MHAPCKAGLLAAAQKVYWVLTCGSASGHPLGTGGGCPYGQVGRPVSCCCRRRLWVRDGIQTGALFYSLMSRGWEETWSPGFDITMVFQPGLDLQTPPLRIPIIPQFDLALRICLQKQPLTAETTGYPS